MINLHQAIIGRQRGDTSPHPKEFLRKSALDHLMQAAAGRARSSCCVVKFRLEREQNFLPR